jgi:hypothetical protein
MSKLFYNIYSNITDRQYFKIEKKMKLWEYRISGALLPSGWMITKYDKMADALIIDYTKKTKLTNGNIGITFDDIPGKISFSFYVAESFDENNYRYFLRAYVFEQQEADFFESTLGGFTDEALKKYNSWNKKEMMDLGEKDKLS